MILIAPHPQLQTRFREDVTRPDGDGGTVTVTREVATHRKDDQGNVITSEPITLFGEPTVEAAGVPNRRMAFSHPFSEDEVRWLEDEFIPTFPGAPNSVQLLEALPSDWRYPEDSP